MDINTAFPSPRQGQNENYFHDVLPRLKGLKSTGKDKWIAKCPAHDDGRPSLSIGVGDSGQWLLFCFAGCAPEDIVAAIDLTMADLWPPDTGQVHQRAIANPVAGPEQTSKIVETYDYCDATGVLKYQIVRKEPKAFLGRRPDGNDGWVWNLNGVARILYRLPELLAADINDWIFPVEGEKDVDHLAKFGLVATCNPHGAGRWGKLSDDSALHGRKVAVTPDADKTGEPHGQDVAATLYRKAASLKVVNLPAMPDYPDGRPRKDITDWILWRWEVTTSAEGAAAQRRALAAELVAMAEAAPEWEPDDEIVEDVAPAVSPYRPFPVEQLPEPVRSFVVQGAKAIGCDLTFVALPLLAAAASAIGNTRRIELKHGWQEPAILWAAIIGESGTLKSPAQDFALRPVRARQEAALVSYTLDYAAYEIEMQRHEIRVADWKKNKGEGTPPVKPEAPERLRTFCDDTTIESLALLLLDNWRGLLMVKDELAGWLGNFDRYSQGRGGGDVPRWLELHGGRSISIDRKTGDHKVVFVPHAALSITGCIAPGPLRRALGRSYFENGLAARLLLACPPRLAKEWTDDVVDIGITNAVAKVFTELYSLDGTETGDGRREPGVVCLSPAAKQVWIKFYNRHAQDHAGLTGDLSAAWSKLEGYAARLALVIHCMRWAAGDETLADVDVVDETSVAAGVALSNWFGTETERVYGILGEDDATADQRRLVELIRRQGGAITIRELMRYSQRGSWRDGTTDDAETVLNELVGANYGRWEHVTTTGKGGRPTRRFVLAQTGPKTDAAAPAVSEKKKLALVTKPTKTLENRQVMSPAHPETPSDAPSIPSIDDDGDSHKSSIDVDTPDDPVFPTAGAANDGPTGDITPTFSSNLEVVSPVAPTDTAESNTNAGLMKDAKTDANAELMDGTKIDVDAALTAASGDGTHGVARHLKNFQQMDDGTAMVAKSPQRYTRGPDPDRPGATDRLTPEQYERYRQFYDQHTGHPSEKHADAWRGALTGVAAKPFRRATDVSLADFAEDGDSNPAGSKNVPPAKPTLADKGQTNEKTTL